MAHYRNWIILVTVVFTLVAFIPSAHADPHALAKPPKPPGGALAECQAKVAELEATNAELQEQMADQEVVIGELEEYIDTLEALYGYTCNGTLSVGGRWCDNLDGTIMDMNTGLIWMKNASCMSADWYAGLTWVTETVMNGVCGLTDGSFLGDWRLPNVWELYGITQGVEGVQCSACLETSRFFVDVNSTYYWTTATFSVSAPAYAYGIGMATHGHMQGWPKTQSLPILPVRNRK